MDNAVVALFGEAEKGVFATPYFLKDMEELVSCLGNPPPESRGLFYAVQALLFQHYLLFFRVSEEGFSIPHYLQGLDILENQVTYPQVTALCVPGVGDNIILDALIPFCRSRHHILITNEADLYDLLTDGRTQRT